MSRNWRAGDIIEVGDIEEGAERSIDVEEGVRVLVETMDQPGVLAQLANTIADCQVNISECVVTTTGDQRAHINLTLDIKELEQLDQVMSDLGALDVVFHVRRIVSGHRRVAIVAKSGIDGDGQRWAELRSGEIVYPDSTSYRNLSIEAEEMVTKG